MHATSRGRCTVRYAITRTARGLTLAQKQFIMWMRLVVIMYDPSRFQNAYGKLTEQKRTTVVKYIAYQIWNTYAPEYTTFNNTKDVQ